MSARVSSALRGSARYAERQRVRRRHRRILFFILFLLLVGTIIFGLRQSALRISHVEIFGADQSLAVYATIAMEGNYFGLVPRDSILFFPEDAIRSSILAEHSDIAALSIFRSGLTGLSIKADVRAPIARWCGLAPTPGVEPYCYLFDSSGVIFSPVASSTEAINPFTLYAPLVGEALEPLRSTIANAESLPATFDFAREMISLGASVTDIAIHDGEVDMHLSSGTRVTYVLGKEQQAFTALISSQENLDITNGSLEYVDLRFDGKVYSKKKTVIRESDTVL